MAAHDDSDWSDSDDEEVSGMETSVLLGVPDGPMEEQKDAEDAAVSRIGGYPVRFLHLIVCVQLIIEAFPLCPMPHSRDFFVAVQRPPVQMLVPLLVSWL